MKTINQEEYGKLNRSLYQLENLLGKMGVKEFCITKDMRSLKIDTDTNEIDPTLINTFCNNIDKLYGQENVVEG
jgi:hypothetical protein